MTEVQKKNLFRMNIYPNRMAAIRQREVKQLFLNAKPRRLEFGGSKKEHFWILFIYSLHHRFVIFTGVKHRGHIQFCLRFSSLILFQVLFIHRISYRMCRCIFRYIIPVCKPDILY